MSRPQPDWTDEQWAEWFESATDEELAAAGEGVEIVTLGGDLELRIDDSESQP